MTVILRLPLPPRELAPNARPHFMAKARAVKRYRAFAYAEARRSMMAWPHQPFTDATIRPMFYFRDCRRRDPDNLLASLKAAFDGLVDAGLLADDNRITHLPVEQRIDRAVPRVELAVTAADKQKEQPDENE